MRIQTTLALLASLLALVAAQFFTRPITRLTGVAEKVAEGDLTARAAIDSEDEVGILATTFNRMTGRLRQTLETLEQRVADRTAELARAMPAAARRDRLRLTRRSGGRRHAYRDRMSPVVAARPVVLGLGPVVRQAAGVAPELLRGVSEWWMVAYSLMLIVMMLLRPEGLLGGRELIPRRWRAGAAEGEPAQS